MEPILTVSHISKHFQRAKRQGGLKDLIVHGFSRNNAKHEPSGLLPRINVLNDISFTLSPTDSLAIMGVNGCGKSTLLSILSGIIRPSSGAITVNGRMGIMLELGSGFCHDLSGRENILLNGLLLGASKEEMLACTDDIIEFSGIRDFIDEPLRTYSSGMQTRLGFAIATHIKPDIMLIDEVLAVGDSEFKRKCYAKLDELKARNVATVLVSHNLEDVRKFCNRGIYLEKGNVVIDDGIEDVVGFIMHEKKEY